MARRMVSVDGAAPHEMFRSTRSRGRACCSAQTACHWTGTRKMLVICSASSVSRRAAGSNSWSGWITVTPPTGRLGAIEPSAAMWNIGAAHRARPSSSNRRNTRMQVSDWAVRFVREHRAFGPARGAGGVHDQRGGVLGTSTGSGAPSRRSRPRRWSGPPPALAPDHDVLARLLALGADGADQRGRTASVTTTSACSR